MPPETLVALVFGVVVFVFRLRAVFRHWAKVGQDMDRLRRARATQWQRLRVGGHRCVSLKREIQRHRKRREHLAEAMDRLSQMLTELKNRTAAPYVLDERRTNNDRTFIAVIRHPSYLRLSPEATSVALRSWTSGRRFVVWAVDEDRALIKIEQRFPTGRGFQLMSLAEETRKNPLSTLEEMTGNQKPTDRVPGAYETANAASFDGASTTDANPGDPGPMDPGSFAGA